MSTDLEPSKLGTKEQYVRNNQNKTLSEILSLLVGTMFTPRNSPISRKSGTKEKSGSSANHTSFIAYLEPM